MCILARVYTKSYNVELTWAFQVNNNGHLTPANPYSEFFPQELPFNTPLIAVFWADSDTEPHDGGFVWYRISYSPDLIERALKDIQSAYPSVPDIDYLLIATWDHIGYYPGQTDKVSYTLTPSYIAMPIFTWIFPSLWSCLGSSEVRAPAM